MSRSCGVGCCGVGLGEGGWRGVGWGGEVLASKVEPGECISKRGCAAACEPVAASCKRRQQRAPRAGRSSRWSSRQIRAAGWRPSGRATTTPQRGSCWGAGLCAWGQGGWLREAGGSRWGVGARNAVAQNDGCPRGISPNPPKHSLCPKRLPADVHARRVVGHCDMHLLVGTTQLQLMGVRSRESGSVASTRLLQCLRAVMPGQPNGISRGSCASTPDGRCSHHHTTSPIVPQPLTHLSWLAIFIYICYKAQRWAEACCFHHCLLERYHQSNEEQQCCPRLHFGLGIQTIDRIEL